MPEDFGAERRLETEEVLQYLALAVQKPFEGTFVLPHLPVMLVGAPVDRVKELYAESIKVATTMWGAQWSADPAIHDKIQLVAQVTDEMAEETRPETVVEACAEVLRVLISGAVIAAKEAGKEAFISTRTQPHFLIERDFGTDSVFVAARARIGVYNPDAPHQSFLLGGGRQLDYALPRALFAGPDRLRFLDQRSPGHLVHEELIKVEAPGRATHGLPAQSPGRGGFGGLGV